MLNIKELKILNANLPGYLGQRGNSSSSSGSNLSSDPMMQRNLFPQLSLCSQSCLNYRPNFAYQQDKGSACPDLLCASCELTGSEGRLAVASAAAAEEEVGSSEAGVDAGDGLLGMPAARSQAPPAEGAVGSKASLRFLPGTCCQSLPKAGKIS